MNIRFGSGGGSGVGGVGDRFDRLGGGVEGEGGKWFGKKKRSVRLGEEVQVGKSLGGCGTVKRDSVVCGGELMKRIPGFLRPART